MKLRLLLIALLTGLVPAACGLGAPAPRRTPTAASSEPSPPPAAATPSPTPLPEVFVLRTPEDAPDWLQRNLFETLERLAQESGREVVTQEPAQDDARPVLLTFVLATPSGSTDWWEGEQGPGVVFLGGPARSSETSVIGGDGWHYDRQAFLAGYVAAMITEDWRVGVLTDSRLPGGSDILGGFASGVRFFCGLCRQVYAPHVEVPLLVDLAGYDSLEAALGQLVQAGVKTVYVAPDAVSEDLQRRLTALGVQALGVHMPADLRELGWVASIRPDPGAALEHAWPELMNGERVELPMPLAILEVDEARLSPGRLQLAQRTLERLLAGEIATGMEP